MAQRILITNHCTVKLPWTMSELAEGLRLCARDLLASPWGLSVSVLQTRTGRIDGELALVDTSDVAGALGYHELSPAGTPYGIVAVKTTMDAGYDPFVTAAHEFDEMAGDMDASALAEVETSGSFKGAAYELCDPVEADRDGYPITLRSGRKLQASNFVLPAWFVPGSPGPWDFRGLLRGPLTLNPGGYMAKYSPSQGWTQVFARPGDGPVMSERAENTTRIPKRAARSWGLAHFLDAAEPNLRREEAIAGVPVL